MRQRSRRKHFIVLVIFLAVAAPQGPTLARQRGPNLVQRMKKAIGQHRERFLGTFARAPRLSEMNIRRIHSFTKNGRSLSTIEFEVKGKNPNWIGVRAKDVRWEATIPGAPGLKARGKLDSMSLPARGSFKVNATATVETGSLPPGMIRGTSVPVDMKTSMTARTRLGTIHFGSGKVAPLRSVNSKVRLTNTRLRFDGALGTEYLTFNMGLPMPRVLDQTLTAGKAVAKLIKPTLSISTAVGRVLDATHKTTTAVKTTTRLIRGKENPRSSTLLTVNMSTPLGIPFEVVGGSMSVTYDGVNVGTATLPRSTLGVAIKEKGKGMGTFRLPLVSQHKNLSTTLTQIRALLDATDRRAGTTPITLEGTFDVRAAKGASIGGIREIPFKINLGPENFSSN